MGGGAHSFAMYFFCSYLDRMKASSVESVCGRRKLSGRLASYTARALLFPICCKWPICSGVHASKFTDLTFEMWTPRFRWIPAHRMHRKTPKFHEAHRGPEREERGPGQDHRRARHRDTGISYTHLLHHSPRNTCCRRLSEDPSGNAGTGLGPASACLCHLWMSCSAGMRKPGA